MRVSLPSSFVCVRARVCLPSTLSQDTLTDGSLSASSVLVVHHFTERERERETVRERERESERERERDREREREREMSREQTQTWMERDRE